MWEGLLGALGGRHFRSALGIRAALLYCSAVHGAGQPAVNRGSMGGWRLRVRDEGLQLLGAFSGLFQSHRPTLRPGPVQLLGAQ